MVGFYRVKCLPFFTCCSCNDVDLNFIYIAYNISNNHLTIGAVELIIFNLAIFKNNKFKAIKIICYPYN